MRLLVNFVGGYELRSNRSKFESLQEMLSFSAKQNQHPMGVVMLVGYAGPGWVWPTAVRSNS
jgi:hypothetical protein